MQQRRQQRILKHHTCRHCATAYTVLASAAAQATEYIKAPYLGRLSDAAMPALRTAAYSKAMHIAVLASAAAQATAYIKAPYLVRLSDAAMPALLTAAYSKAMHIAVLASAAAQAQHPAAYSQAIYV